MNNGKKLDKTKFNHCSHQLIFTETFIYKSKICYVVQCLSKQVFIGKAYENFQLISYVSVKDKITSICFNQQSNTLYLGGFKGNIYYINIDIEKPEISKIDSIDGKEIKGIIAIKQSEHQQIVISFSERAIRKYENNKLSKTQNLTSPLTKAVINKNPKSQEDIYCAFFIQNIQFPIIADLIFLHRIFQEKNETKAIEEYVKSMDYEEDQLATLVKNPPTITVLSNTLAIFVTASNNSFSVFQISKKQNYLYIIHDVQLEVEEEILDLDLEEDCLLIISKKGISSFNLTMRKIFVKNLLFKGSTEYNVAKWAQLDTNKQDYQIYYGSKLHPTMKLLSLKLKSK